MRACRGAGELGETLLFVTGNETLKCGESPVASLLPGDVAVRCGTPALNIPPLFAVLQCFGGAHEPTNPSHSLFPLFREEKTHTRTETFILAGFVALIIYV